MCILFVPPEAEAISFHHPPPVAQQPSGDEKQPMATTMSQTLQVHELHSRFH